MARHRIGLSQAWQAPEGEGAAPVWVRWFGRPSGLEETDRVLLVVEGASIAAELTLNGSRLGCPAASPSRAEFDVTSLLRQRNELLLAPVSGARPPSDVSKSPIRADRQPLWPSLGAVCLEIVAADEPGIA